MGDGLPYRIEIDRSVCMGSGVCVVYAAETFDIDEETKAVVHDAAGNPLAQIEAAIAGIPPVPSGSSAPRTPDAF